MPSRAEQDAAEADAVAAIAERLAVLLAAGVAPASAWAHLADDAPSSTQLPSIASAAAAGKSVPQAILAGLGPASPAARSTADSAWRGIAAAWQVASEAGASLAPALSALSGTLRSHAQLDRRSSVALTAPVATARMVTVLPLVGVLFGIVLGFDPLGVLFGTAPGMICLVAGALLALCAQAWNRRLVALARTGDHTPGLLLDLMAIAVSGGTSMHRARGLVRSACELCGIADAALGSVDSILRLSERAGAPVAVLLRSAADEARRTAGIEGERRVAALAVRLMLPLGLCILPAFMLLGVAPVVVSVISSTSLGF